MVWRTRVRTGRGATGTGSATSNGGAIDQTRTVAGVAQIFDVTGVSRPISVAFTIGAGDSLDMFTSTVPAALADANHPSWTEARATSGANTIEMVTNRQVIGIRVRRTVGGGSSSVRLFAPIRDGNYNPVYNPSYDIAPAGLNDTRRFLDQATMGSSMAEIDAFSGSYGAWINAQMAITEQMDPSPNPAVDNNAGQFSSNATAVEVYRKQIVSPARLRMRVAHAISQMVVAGYTANMFQADGKSWWTGLMTHAFSNYKNVLRHACRHRHMGFFLNQWVNNARNGVFPNQNFARELLQLFTLGQEAMNRDGTLQYNPNGTVRRAYVQEDINALSRMVTGWGIIGAPILTSREMDPQPLLAYNGPAMTFYGRPVLSPEGRTEGSATPPVNGYTPTVPEVEARVEQALDIIMAQPTIAPFVCRHMITRLTTDNPSPQYIRRVVSAFENNGFGERGNMGAVVRAILLDPEARGNSVPETAGRAIEPSLAWSRLFRYMNQPNIPAAFDGALNDHIWHWTTDGTSGQFGILRQAGNWQSQPATVFYDYPSTYEAGPGFKAPAVALRSTASIAAWLGIGISNIENMAGDTLANNNAWGRWLATDLVALHTATAGAVAVKDAAVIDRMYADLHQGRAPSTDTRNALIAFAATAGLQAMTVRRRICWLAGMMTGLSEHWRCM